MKNESWQRRIQVLGAIFVIFAAIIFYRLFDKQVINHDKYLVLAQNQYMVEENTTASRGIIYFSDMFPAATNAQNFQIIVVPKQVKNKQKTALDLSENLINTSYEEIYTKINVDKNYIPPIKKGLSEEVGKKIAELKLAGVVVMPQNTRVYPENELASQILGFVDAEGNGHYGIEGYFNEELKGVDGINLGQKSADGQIIDINNSTQSRAGTDIVLTINHDIQFKIEQILSESVKKYQADSGVIVISEPSTGKVIAMANYPTYNPNLFNKVEDQQLFNNQAIFGAWEPGSVIKPIVMSAAISENKVQPDTIGVFGGELTINGYKIRNSTMKAYGEETMTQVLENSDNIAMVWISQLLGKEGLYKYLKDYGFGRKTGIELDVESAGELTEPKRMSDVQQANMAFGQGITATPLQVLEAINAIANKGLLMQSHIVFKTIDYSGKEDIRQEKELTQVISEDAAKKTAEMMVSVVENGHGKKAAVSGYKVAGKTGTAQVPKPGGGYYDDRHIGSFAGFAPVDDPKFAIIVRLDNPKNVDWAESSAAPTFSEVAKWLFSYMGIEKTQ